MIPEGSDPLPPPRVGLIRSVWAGMTSGITSATGTSRPAGGGRRDPSPRHPPFPRLHDRLQPSPLIVCEPGTVASVPSVCWSCSAHRHPRLSRPLRPGHIASYAIQIAKP